VKSVKQQISYFYLTLLSTREVSKNYQGIIPHTLFIKNHARISPIMGLNHIPIFLHNNSIPFNFSSNYTTPRV
jgi:hypothetical protein